LREGMVRLNVEGPALQGVHGLADTRLPKFCSTGLFNGSAA
jgi:hypothetical protein